MTTFVVVATQRNGDGLSYFLGFDGQWYREYPEAEEFPSRQAAKKAGNLARELPEEGVAFDIKVWADYGLESERVVDLCKYKGYNYPGLYPKDSQGNLKK